MEAAIHELMDLTWNVVYDLLVERGLLRDGLFVEKYTGIRSWLDGPDRYTVVHSAQVAVLFAGTCPVDVVVFHHDLLGADDPKGFFTLPGRPEGPRSRAARAKCDPVSAFWTHGLDVEFEGDLLVRCEGLCGRLVQGDA